jgi:Arc/MetJ-type ribon-helix-helix transcriptional regulator
MKELLDRQVAAAGFASVSEYFEDLLRRQEEKRRAKAALEIELQRGLESPAKRMTDADWDAINRRLEAKIAAQAVKKC